MKIGKYFKIGLAAATLIGGAACEMANPRATGEGDISDIYNKNGYQIVEITIRRDAGDSLEPPPFFIKSPIESSVPMQVVLASKKPIDAQTGDRLNFRYKHDKNRNEFERGISGWTKLKWCQVYPRR